MIMNLPGDAHAIGQSDRQSMSGRRFWLTASGLWLLASLLLLAAYSHSIAWHDFADVDDQLRLVEVRDWLAGQSFYDVTQYRTNAPYGAPMHWSRLVDLPLALVIILLRPFLGPAAAETIAAVTVPLLTLGVIMAAAAATGRRLADPAVGLIAAGFCALCIPTVLQITPLRVDHHGWEIALQLLALCAVVDRNVGRGACVAGLALATALQISLEPLPFSAAACVALGLWWAVAPNAEQKRRLTMFIVTLSILEWVLFSLLHAPTAWSKGFCDAVSPPHLLMFGISALGIILVTKLPLKSNFTRLLGLGAAALSAAAGYRAYPPHCGVDAFNNLEPIVRELWYDRVLEGLPFWHLPPILAASTIGFPLIGSLCAIYAVRHQDRDRLPYWIAYAFLLVSATVAAALVQRASGFACAAATPAGAWMIVRFLPKIRHGDSVLIRVFGTVILCLAFSPIAPVTAMTMIASADPDAVQIHKSNVRACSSSENIARLSALSPTRLLAPLDLGPSILFWTRLSPLASGHHRNHVAMAEVLTAFTGSANVAHTIIKDRGIGYVILCPTSSEIAVYRRVAPTGFAASLMAGRQPDWLVPVRLSGDPVQIWHVVDNSRR